MQSAPSSRRATRSGLWLTAALAAGCATTAPSPPVPVPSQAVESVAPPPAYIPVVRYGRYTLVELAPTEDQRNLLLQVVDVVVPDTLHASVGDALRHVLLRSGYRLCSGPETDALSVLPLPAAHYQLGPMVLRDALLTLAGPAWELHADDAARQVCFRPTVMPADPVIPLPAPVEGAEPPATTFPLVEEAQP